MQQPERNCFNGCLGSIVDSCFLCDILFKVSFSLKIFKINFIIMLKAEKTKKEIFGMIVTLVNYLFL